MLFRSDRKEALTDVLGFSAGLEAVSAKLAPVQVELVWRAAVFYALAHQLDQPGTPERAYALFTKVLEVAPDHAAANYFFGVFLSGAGRPKEALPHLEKAKAAGVAPAERALGVAYLSSGDVPRALDCLRSHVKKHPEDDQTATLVKGLEGGKVRFEQVPVR